MTTPDLALVRQMDNAQEGYRPVAGGWLSLDVERARGVVRELREVAGEVAALAGRVGPTRVVPPGDDEVSRNAAVESTRMLLAGRYYLATWHADLLAGIAALERQIADYEGVDRASSVRL